MPVLGSEGWNLKYPWEGAMQEGRFRVELYNLSYSAFIFMGEKEQITSGSPVQILLQHHLFFEHTDSQDLEILSPNQRKQIYYQWGGGGGWVIPQGEALEVFNFLCHNFFSFHRC